MKVMTNELPKEDLVKKMFDLGAHFGYARESRHPSTKPFLFGLKNKTIIIDLEKTADSLKAAEDFVYGLGQTQKAIIFVGTKKEASYPIEKFALVAGLPFVSERWIGGTMTNFKEIRGRINRLIDLKDQEVKGELAKYTKKERNVIAKEVADLERYFGSLTSMTKLPAAIFVIDPKKEKIAVDEAKRCGLPVIALANSDCDLTNIDYPIVANDAQVKVISFFAEAIANAYLAGLKESKEETNVQHNN